MPLNDSWQKLKHVTKKKKTTDDVSRPTEGGTQLISATPDRSIFLGGGGNTVNSRNASVDTDKPLKILADKVLYFVNHPLLSNTVTETSPLFLRKSSVVVRSLVW